MNRQELRAESRELRGQWREARADWWGVWTVDSPAGGGEGNGGGCGPDDESSGNRDESRSAGWLANPQSWVSLCGTDDSSPGSVGDGYGAVTVGARLPHDKRLFEDANPSCGWLALPVGGANDGGTTGEPARSNGADLRREHRAPTASPLRSMPDTRGATSVGGDAVDRTSGEPARSNGADLRRGHRAPTASPLRSCVGVLRAACVALLLLLSVATARAQDLDFLFTPNEQSGLTGQTVTFLGFLDNTLGSTAVFQGLDVSFLTPGIDPGDITTVFGFADLDNNDARSESIFSVYLGPSVATGSYFGTATLSYDYNGGASSGDITQNFRLNVTNNNIIPEPAMLQLPALLGLAGVAWWRRRPSKEGNGHA